MFFKPISCRRAAELTSKGMDRPLSVFERLALRYHALVCHALPCTEFVKKLSILRGACEEIGEAESSEAQLSDARKEKIRAALREAQRDADNT